MPTFWHVAVVRLVPASNLLLWLRICRNARRGSAVWLAFANGAAIAIAALYALLFLPLLPIAVVGVMFGIGLLPFAPLASFVSALRLRSGFARPAADRHAPAPAVGGIGGRPRAAARARRPAAATRHRHPMGSEQRAVGTRARACAAAHARRRRSAAAPVLRRGRPADRAAERVRDATATTRGSTCGARLPAVSPRRARSTIGVHGMPFNARPAPFENGKWSRFADFQFDDDHGGTQVGGRLKGLSLVSSRIDGSISGDDAVAYLEWTVEFRNYRSIDREARVQFALPPRRRGVARHALGQRRGARGGLWRTRRGARRLSAGRRAAAARPAARHHQGRRPRAGAGVPGSAQRRHASSSRSASRAPLEIIDAGKARLTLPAMVDRNFSFAPEPSHSIWIESKQALAASAPGLAASQVRRPSCSASPARSTIASFRRTRPADHGRSQRRRRPCRRALRRGRADRAGDRARRAQPTRRIDAGDRWVGAARRHEPRKLIAALDAIPPALKVGAIIASEPSAAVSPWRRGPTRRSSGREAAALHLVLGRAGQRSGARRGAAGARGRAERRRCCGSMARSRSASAAAPRGWSRPTARLSRLPDVVLYSVEPGPNELLPDAPWAWGARSLPQTGALDADLAGFLARASGAERRRSRSAARRSQPTDGIAKGSDHIARLWANDRVLELMRAIRRQPRRGGRACDAISSGHAGQRRRGARDQAAIRRGRLTPVSQAHACRPFPSRTNGR